MPPLDAHARPQAALALLFALWKAFLLSVTQGTRLFSSTPDYDTSTSLFLTRQYGPAAPSPASPGHVLTRWDALYFVSAVRDGKLFEQEWAFGHAFSLVVRAFSGSTGAGGSAGGNGWEPAAAVAVANAAHLLGVLALYRLTLSVSRSGRLALAAAALHVVSPAGVFLAAPYAESSYALLAILGNWAFVAAGGKPALHRAVLLSVSGVLFGLATLFRSNGLGSGVLFAAEAIRCLLALCRSPRPSRVFALVGPVLGGICVGIGAAAPQVVAWQRYCDIAEPRPWCGGAIPSIYSFVQEHYWNVGFLRYWTPNQIPLFLLAAPVLGLLILSGLQVARYPSWVLPLPQVSQAGDGSAAAAAAADASAHRRLFVRVLAGTQAFVALLAITNYHVQVITRLASGYVVWYWWIAGWLGSQRRPAGQSFGQGVVVFFVMYAGIQAALFASFLPPA